MTDENYQVRRVKLDESDANRLAKWASLWADLVHADIALAERAGLPDTASNVFVRRSLWEAAVVSYGRMAVSDKRRNVDYEELIRAARGDRGVKFHQTLMVWRHDHVAHRKSGELETVDVYADYLDSDPHVLDSIRVAVWSSGGPPEGSQLVVEFAEHVKSLRDTLWVNYLAPIGELIATRGPRSSTVSVEPEKTEALVIQQVLWSRMNRTEIADGVESTS